MNHKYLKLSIVLLLLIWSGFLFARKIDLTTADLGRHIMNGQIIVEAPMKDKFSVLNTNFYSYTENDHAFINHHWGSGVVFYFVWIFLGFTGLSWFYVLLCLATILVFWDIARRQSNFIFASLAILLVLPIVASRTEVRPEIFSYFLTGVFFWIVYRREFLWSLPPLMLVWVNLHIGFIFGFLVLGAFSISEMMKFLKKKENIFTKLLAVSGLSLLTAMVNPFGFYALLYPLNIFQNYGYRIVENQSVKFLENLSMDFGKHFTLFKILILGGIISFILKYWQKKNLDIHNFLLFFSSAVLAYMGIRHFPIFGFFIAPIIAGNLYAWFTAKTSVARDYGLQVTAVILVIFFIWTEGKIIAREKPILGFGLYPQVLASIQFFKENNLSGPIFNNYDIGGYLIYGLYPQEKVFTDNRPEAYSEKFFQEIYVPIQQDENKWRKIEKEHNFKTIFFSHRDYTPWGQKFLISRVNDQKWVPVYADDYNIIFIRNSAENAEIARKFAIPRERFAISGPM